MHKKQILFMICFAFLTLTVPAQAGFMTLVHGLPALPGALPSNNPVDIALDGECKFFYVSYGQNLLMDFEVGGRRSVIFYESIPDTPCRGTVLGALDFDLDKDDEVDVTLHLNSKDEVIVSLWDNTVSLDVLDKRKKTVVEYRNAAAGPALRALLKRGKRSVDSEISNGDVYGPIKTRKGEHIFQIKNGSEVLDQDTGKLKKRRVYWVYITGSVDKKTVDLLTLESIPDAEGEDQDHADCDDN